MTFLKDYEPVEDRLRAFWKDHPLGRIATELVHVDNDCGYIVKASVWTDIGEEAARATGFAEEHMTEGHRVNQTWPLENCETSAIGRCLANLGYAPKGKRPSREEISKPSDAATGEAENAGPGGGSASGKGEGHKPSPYPFDPLKCGHKFPSGHWLKWDEEGNCPRCGTPKLVAMEGTTADLGPA